MSVMDVADPGRTLLEVAPVVRPGGLVPFPVVHPVMSPPAGRWVDDGQGVRQARVIGGYFCPGPLTQTWRFAAAPSCAAGISRSPSPPRAAPSPGG
jgi:hypothetical protein